MKSVRHNVNTRPSFIVNRTNRIGLILVLFIKHKVNTRPSFILNRTNRLGLILVLFIIKLTKKSLFYTTWLEIDIGSTSYLYILYYFIIINFCTVCKEGRILGDIGVLEIVFLVEIVHYFNKGGLYRAILPGSTNNNNNHRYYYITITITAINYNDYN